MGDCLGIPGAIGSVEHLVQIQVPPSQTCFSCPSVVGLDQMTGPFQPLTTMKGALEPCG